MSGNRLRILAGALAALGLPISVALMAASAPAQPAMSIDQLAFMTGHWTRTTDGMHVEQVFLPPAAGTLVGMQRRTEKGATLVSYFFLIEEKEGTVVCRFKHFENDYTTYEDRNDAGPRTFTLIEQGEATATFEERTPDGSLLLRYRITDSGQLGIAVGSREGFQSSSVTESLHDRLR